MKDKYILVKRTPRGSLVSIEIGGREKCLIKTTNLEDLKDITDLLNRAGVDFRMFQKEPPPHRPMRREIPIDTNWYIEFNFEDLAPVRDVLVGGLLEEGKE